LNRAFIDSSFAIALVNEKDELHSIANELSNDYEGQPLVTTDAIILEIGSALSKRYREDSFVLIEDFMSSSEVEVVHLDHSLLTKGFEIYKSYKDKSWSLTDCISFVTMRRFRLADALSSDKHFEQAGFNILMKR